MNEIKVCTVPENKGKEEINYKYQKIVEDRNKSISKLFKMDPLDLELKMYISTGALKANVLDTNKDGMGVFAGYREGQDIIHVAHPDAVFGLFTDVDKELGKLIDDCLVRFYLCKKYYPEDQDYKIYHKYLSAALAEMTSERFQKEVVQFDIKRYDEEVRFTKDQELKMVFYIMLEKSGLNFIYENLDTIMKDLDIKKSVFAIYKKSYTELLRDYKKEIEAYQKQINIRKNR